MIQVLYNLEWADCFDARMKWDGTIFKNGGFSGNQPVTTYSVVYANNDSSCTITNDAISAYSFGTTIICPDNPINFDTMKYKTLTISGIIGAWESVGTWYIGFCTSKPSTSSWDYTEVKTVATYSQLQAAYYTKEFSVSFNIDGISGEKYICFKGVDSEVGSRRTNLEIQTFIFE